MSRSRRVAVGVVVAVLAVLPGVASARSWTIESVPEPALATSSVLSSVSCPSSDSCVAVGYWEAPSTATLGFTDQPFAERWDGSSWTEQDLPDPGRANNVILTGVSCSGSSSCTAVGYTEVLNPGAIPPCAVGGDCPPDTPPPPSTYSFTAVAERWNGQSWGVQTVATPAADTQLTGVSCSSLTSCTAVGASYSSGAQGQQSTPVAEQWNGNSWGALGPKVTPPEGAFEGVSCLDSSACIAGGSDPIGLLAEQWDGFIWIRQASRDPWAIVSSNAATFSGVSCTDATVCTAVGYHQGVSGSGTATGSAFAEQVSEGALWHVKVINGPTGASGVQMNSVSCLSAWACHAVGTYHTGGSSGNANPLWAYWNGIYWSTTEPPTPVGSGESSLQGVSCAEDGSCMAVGDASVGAVGAPYVLRYS